MLQGRISRGVYREVVGATLEAALLDGMGQFVGDEVAAAVGIRLVFAGSEGDVVARGVGVGVDGAGGVAGLRVGMDSHLAEIMAEAGLHEITRARVQRVPRRRERAMNGLGRGDRCGRTRGEALD